MHTGAEISLDQEERCRDFETKYRKLNWISMRPAFLRGDLYGVLKTFRPACVANRGA
jgi:hypothetical protein